MLPRPLDPSMELEWEAGFEQVSPNESAPGVSVIIPVFNAGAFLEKTLRSLLCNDLSGVEIILVDGGSTDNTPQIVDHYRHIFSHIISEPDNGQSNAINKGMGLSTQYVLTWLNGDDLYLPNALTLVRNFFERKRGVDVVVGNAFLTEKDLSPIRHHVYSDESLQFSHLINYARNHLVQPSVFFSRRAWNLAGPVREDLHYAMDAFLFLKMSQNFRLAHLNADLALSVYHESCKTRGRRAESISELALVQAELGGIVEAKETLSILVSMYNDLNASKPDSPSRVQILTSRLRSLEQEFEATKLSLLELNREAIDI